MIIENKNRKLSRITTSDNIAFKYNNDVLFACFNDDNYHHKKGRSITIIRLLGIV